MAVGGGVLLVGLLIAFAGEPSSGLSLAMIGGVVYLAARFGAWWHHG